jgi:hypothetical protein
LAEIAFYDSHAGGLMILCKTEMKRAAIARQRFHGSNHKPNCIGDRMMAVEQYKPELFFIQLSDIAPAISKLLKTYTSRIRAHVSVGDVINRYGVSINYQVFIEVLTDRCRGCNETQFSPPNFGDCKDHRFVKEWREIASGEAKEGTQEALRRADSRVAAWLKKRGVK